MKYNGYAVHMLDQPRTYNEAVNCSEPYFFLGMKVDEVDGDFSISQTAYISELAAIFGLSVVKLSSIPMFSKKRDLCSQRRREANNCHVLMTTRV